MFASVRWHTFMSEYNSSAARPSSSRKPAGRGCETHGRGIWGKREKDVESVCMTGVGKRYACTRPPLHTFFSISDQVCSGTKGRDVCAAGCRDSKKVHTVNCAAMCVEWVEAYRLEAIPQVASIARGAPNICTTTCSRKIGAAQVEGQGLVSNDVAPVACTSIDSTLISSELLARTGRAWRRCSIGGTT